jgi:hypothetical protein
MWGTGSFGLLLMNTSLVFYNSSDLHLIVLDGDMEEIVLGLI